MRLSEWSLDYYADGVKNDWMEYSEVINITLAYSEWVIGVDSYCNTILILDSENHWSLS